MAVGPRVYRARGRPAGGLAAAVLRVFWGRRLARLGVGLHRRLRALSDVLLVDVLSRLGHPELHDRARERGARLREVRGAASGAGGVVG